jgi:hypothetical protein
MLRHARLYQSLSTRRLALTRIQSGRFKTRRNSWNGWSETRGIGSSTWPGSFP